MIVHQLISQIRFQPFLTKAVAGNLGRQIAQLQTMAKPRLQVQLRGTIASVRQIKSKPMRLNLGLAPNDDTPFLHRLGLERQRFSISMPGSPTPSSAELATYLEQRGELSKPWMLQLLRLTKLKEAKNSMDPDAYMASLQEAHADLMRLGEFWKGREQEVFNGRYQPETLIEPLPGSPEDR